MLDGLAPEIAPRLWIAIGGVTLAFIVLIAILVFLKRRNSPLFVKGGRGREHRLHVLDAAAVDAKRRLVLIRRDGTEHLIMIGGPTDIVIETGINREQPKAQITESRETAVRMADLRPADPAPILGRTAETRAIETPRPQPRLQAPASMEARQPSRQAEQASSTKRAPQAETGSVSAMGSMLYDDDREPLTGNPTPRLQPISPSPPRVEPIAKAGSIAATAEDILDQARQRVLPAQRPAEKPADIEADMKAELERRLEASRAEAQRIEAEKAEAERRLALEKAEADRAEASRREAERAARARAEAERAEAAKARAARIEAENQEALRLAAEAERAEAARAAAARSEALARFEASRRLQAEQRLASTTGATTTTAAQLPVSDRADPVMTTDTNDTTRENQQHFTSDFEKLLEAELEESGVLDGNGVPSVAGERRQPAFSANTLPRETSPITGATPGLSTEQDMARRLGEISLNKNTDALNEPER